MAFLSAAQLGIGQPAKLPTGLLKANGSNELSQKDAALTAAQNTKKAFSQFVGETYYGTMLKSMRKTVGESAYFNGGQAEELFRGQLDQEMSAKLAGRSNGLADTLFKSQFPEEAALIEQDANKSVDEHSVDDNSSLKNLAQLTQR